MICEPVKRKYYTVEEYISDQDPSKRALLQELRSAIKKLASDAEEIICLQTKGSRI